MIYAAILTKDGVGYKLPRTLLYILEAFEIEITHKDKMDKDNIYDNYTLFMSNDRGKVLEWIKEKDGR